MADDKVSYLVIHSCIKMWYNCKWDWNFYLVNNDTDKIIPTWIKIKQYILNNEGWKACDGKNASTSIYFLYWWN